MWPWVWIGLLVHTCFCGHSKRFSPQGFRCWSCFQMWLWSCTTRGCYDKYYSFVITVITVPPLGQMSCACCMWIQKGPRCLSLQVKRVRMADNGTEMSNVFIRRMNFVQPVVQSHSVCEKYQLSNSYSTSSFPGACSTWCLVYCLEVFQINSGAIDNISCLVALKLTRSSVIILYG